MRIELHTTGGFLNDGKKIVIDSKDIEGIEAGEDGSTIMLRSGRDIEVAESAEDVEKLLKGTKATDAPSA